MGKRGIKMQVIVKENKVCIEDGKYMLWIEPWGKDYFRIRMTGEANMDHNDWALTDTVDACDIQVTCVDVAVKDTVTG